MIKKLSIYYNLYTFKELLVFFNIYVVGQGDQQNDEVGQESPCPPPLVRM